MAASFSRGYHSAFSIIMVRTITASLFYTEAVKTKSSIPESAAKWAWCEGRRSSQFGPQQTAAMIQTHVRIGWALAGSVETGRFSVRTRERLGNVGYDGPAI